VSAPTSPYSIRHLFYDGTAVFRLALVGLLLVSGVACSADSIVLKRPDGTTFSFPLSGPQYDPRAEKLVREIQELDKLIEQSSKGAPRDVAIALRQIASEYRKEAVDNLELAVETAQQTSSLQLDSKLIGKAADGVKGFRQLVNSPTPNSLRVKTQISTTISDAQIHYLGKADHELQLFHWSSYTPGDRLVIGRYVFRVQSEALPGGSFQEEVRIFSDPAMQVLSPIVGVPK
jgi:hypothetical protein